MSNCCVDNEIIDITGLCKPEKINLSQYPFWTQIFVPEIVRVPEQKPEIEQIDAVNISVEILRKKVIVTPFNNINPGIIADAVNLEGKKVTGRKLIIEGVLCNTVTYTANKPDQSVHTAHVKLPFSAYIVVPANLLNEDALNINFDIVSCVEDVFVKEFCGRNIFINVTLLLQAVPKKKTCEESCDQSDSCCEQQIFIKGVCSEEKLVNLLVEQVEGVITLNTNWTELFVPEILEIPNQKPNIEQILSVTSKAEVISQKIIDTPKAVLDNFEGIHLTGKKLIVEAILRQKVMYTAAVPEQSVHTAHFDVPFSAFIVIPLSTPYSAKFQVDICIEDIFICAVDERDIFKNVTLFIKAKDLTCP